MPVFREIMLRVYEAELVGTPPQFPREMEDRIDAYLATPPVPARPGPIAVDMRTRRITTEPSTVTRLPDSWSGMESRPMTRTVSRVLWAQSPA